MKSMIGKSIDIEFDGAKYRLEFNRRSVEEMEKTGFLYADLQARPLATFPVLFAGSFRANHPFVKRDVVNSIYKSFRSNGEFLSKLIEMFTDTYTSLFDGSDDDEEVEGNVSWTPNW